MDGLKGVSKSPSQEVFYGEILCQKSYTPAGSVLPKPCSNKAYYKQSGKYVCGVHSDNNRRVKLDKNPNAKQHKADEIDRHQATVDRATALNQSNGRPGKVVCSKLRMMKSAEDKVGYLKVFPNAKHQNRKDGFGCASLSPKCLGPIHHKQKGLPPAANLENYHQYNKVFPSEVSRDRAPNKSFFKRQKEGYRSKDGHRHKMKPVNGIKQKPLYSLHRDNKGNEKRYTYLQSRYLYCHFYEELARNNGDLKKLKSMLKEGTNLQIVGFDGYDVCKDLMAHYVDTSRPFGHEMCLYTMLVEEYPKNYPWNRYYWDHTDLYPSYLCPGPVTGVTECIMDEAADSSSGDSN